MKFQLVVALIALSAVAISARSTQYSKSTKIVDLKRRIAACQGNLLCGITTTSNTCTLECVPKSYMCNGTTECANGADEAGCPTIPPPPPPPPVCPPGNYLCSDNTTCIARDKLCDNTDDCPVGADDEANCNPGKYICLSGLAIDSNLFCDGTPHCPDNDDEPQGCGDCVADAATPAACTAANGAAADINLMLAQGQSNDFELCRQLCCGLPVCNAFMIDFDASIGCALFGSAVFNVGYTSVFTPFAGAACGQGSFYVPVRS